MMILKKTSQRLQKGFTLVEVLIYLAIFTVVSTASVGFLISLDEFVDQYKIETVLYRSGTNAMEQIVLSIRQADSVDLLNTVEDLPLTGKLTVDTVATTTTISLDSGELELEINGEELGDMTNSLVTVDGFTVYYYPLTEGEFVRVKLELSATVNSVSKSITLYGGAVVRGAI